MKLAGENDFFPFEFGKVFPSTVGERGEFPLEQFNGLGQEEGALGWLLRGKRRGGHAVLYKLIGMESKKIRRCSKYQDNTCKIDAQIGLRTDSVCPKVISELEWACSAREGCPSGLWMQS